MHYAGAIRLDHVLGLKRLYVIPAGVSADQGVYLRMPFEQLLAVVAQESVSHRCIVIGEDLGTVPAGLRDTLADWGIWRYHVLIFERGPDGAFIAPANYARNALVTNTTHDLPTFCGWCTGADIRLRRGLGLDTGETEADREAACTRLREALLDAGGGPLGFAAVVRFMNATPSRLLMISIEDVLELTDQPNLPGTTVEHPNWQRRLPVTLERMPALDLLKRASDLLQARRRQPET
jgi:4-alpha-glucanotransferase